VPDGAPTSFPVLQPAAVLYLILHASLPCPQFAPFSSSAPALSDNVGDVSAPKLISTDQTVEDPSAFALEEHLEDFLVKNWAQTELAKDYDIYEEDGEKAQQYQTDTGPLDILAISKDKKRRLVVELKKGRASDAVVGQTLRYMSFVQEMLAEKDQTVHGIVIALEDDQRIRRALAMVSNILFYRYQISLTGKPAMTSTAPMNRNRSAAHRGFSSFLAA
jgi:Endonuclease NucS